MLNLQVDEQQIKDLVTVNEELSKNVGELGATKHSLSQENDRLVVRYKDKMSRLQEAINLLTADRERLKTNLDASEGNLKSLTDEHEKLRNRAKQVKYYQAEREDEKACKNCKKLFRDDENFNWSCKVHSSTFSGDIWWCCGKKGEQAPGCKICMHESKQERTQLLDGEISTKKLVCSVTYK